MKKDQNRNTRSFPPKGINVFLFLFFTFLSLHPDTCGQQIELNANQEPLNQVMIRLVEEHSIQVSFDDRLLSRYPVTVNQTFESTEEAIAFLLKSLPLDYEKVDGVYIIFNKEAAPELVEYSISGRIIDQLSGESLPYSHLVINSQGTITDFSGHFSSPSSLASTFEVAISHLGYYPVDTVLVPGKDHILGLIPSVFEFEEVKIRGRSVERSGEVGEYAGVMRLNHKIADRLPGNGDDAVFNFLRLQPGIMAAGEQSSEMIIWGGYSGDSQLLFDGFTIFGPRNFNDNISFVNPFMTKEIRVLKGGYSAEYGERVGGIVEVTGIEGSRLKPNLKININNMTISGMASFPVNEKAAITAAFRHTYYNLYGADKLGFLSGRSESNINSGIDVTVSPYYRFRDANLKYAGSTGRGDHYYISLYSGGDHFSYELEDEQDRVSILQETSEKSRQTGGTAFFGRTWRNGFLSNFSLSYSALNRKLFERQEIFLIDRGSRISLEERQYISNISEVKFSNENYLNLWEKHNILAGAGYVYNRNLFLLDFEDLIYPDGFAHAGRINLFVQDEYHPVSSVELKPGVRIGQQLIHPYIFFQPRFQISVKFGENWKVNGAWGIYNQFIAKTSLLDELGNYRYFWIICDNKSVPVLKAKHTVGGIIYQHENLTLSIEPFYKTLEGISRILETNGGEKEVYQGQARIYGTDLLAKKYFGKHEAWVSYTLSKTKEHFPYFNADGYLSAPQDQRHEIKGVLLLDFKPFYFTVNYVYGSGLAYRSSLLDGTGDRYPYSRLDASLIYRLKLNAFRIESGISILNLLNRENIKYSNLFEVPDGQFSSISIHAEAVPFTPTLYVNFAF